MTDQPFRPSPAPPPGWEPPADPWARPDGMFGCGAQPRCQEWFEEQWVEHGGLRFHPHCAPEPGLPVHTRRRHPTTARLMAEAVAEQERAVAERNRAWLAERARRRVVNQHATTDNTTPLDTLWNHPHATNQEGGH